jgi:hypothetical protein
LSSFKNTNSTADAKNNNFTQLFASADRGIGLVIGSSLPEEWYPLIKNVLAPLDSRFEELLAATPLASPSEKQLSSFPTICIIA